MFNKILLEKLKNMQINKVTSIMLFVALIMLSCNQSGDQQNSAKEQAPQKEQVQQNTSSGELDAFGRSPGDPHYGHNHASDQQSGQQNNATQKPANGEPDQFGRKPGDEHYGHNHK